jgi:hypothetical protein
MDKAAELIMFFGGQLREGPILYGRGRRPGSFE